MFNNLRNKVKRKYTFKHLKEGDISRYDSRKKVLHIIIIILLSLYIICSTILIIINCPTQIEKS